MTQIKIGTKEAIMLIVAIVITRSVLSLPKALLSSSGSATILNIIYVGIIAILFAWMIFKLFQNFKGSDILDVSEILGGKVFKNIIGIIFISYFIFASGVLLRRFCEGIKVVYFPLTNTTYLVLLFIIAILIVNKLHFNSSLKTNLMIVPIAFSFGFLLFFSNIEHFSPQKIFPILGDGLFNTFVLGIGNIFSFGGIVYLYFLPPLLKEPEKFKKIALVSIGISFIYLLLIISTLLFMFSFFMDTDEIMTLYTAATYIEFGSFFQRLESIFLLTWILVFACYLSIIIKFVIIMFKKMTNIKDYSPLTTPFALLIFSVSLTPRNSSVLYFLETSVYKNLNLSIVFVLGFSILLLANWKIRKKRKVGALS